MRNPVSRLFDADGRTISDRALTRLGMRISVVVCVLTLLPLLIPLFTQELLRIDAVPATIAFWASALVSTFSPVVAMVIASGMIARMITREEFELVRLTDVSADTVESGCVEGIGERLRILRGIGFWILPAGFIGYAFVIGTMMGPRVFFDVRPVNFHFVEMGFKPALVWVAAAMLVYRLIWQWCIRIGVWIGLWLDKHGQAASGAAATLFAAMYAFVVLRSYGISWAGIYPIASIVFVGIVWGLSRFARGESIWILDEKARS